MLGSPYVWGGTTSAGFDCSGFVSYCLSGQEGTRLGTTADFVNWNQTDNPQPGDICVIHDGSSQHTGIYVGDGRMIHAATYGVGVIESDVQDGMIFVTYN
jgi:cell wall-associated NlpC family hydrolase